MYAGSAIKEIGLKPVGKYGPVGDVITYNKAVVLDETPKCGFFKLNN